MSKRVNLYQKFWCLLDRKQKNISVRLIFLTVAGAIFEAAGVGLIIPFISVVTADDIVLPMFILNALPLLNSLNQKEIIFSMVVFFVLFYLLKSIFLMFLAAVQAGYYYGLQESISTRLFGSYLRRPYTFHLQHNTVLIMIVLIRHL